MASSVSSYTLWSSKGSLARSKSWYSSTSEKQSLARIWVALQMCWYSPYLYLPLPWFMIGGSVRFHGNFSSLKLWASLNRIFTVLGHKASPRFGEFYSCCFTLLPGLAYNNHTTWGQPFSRALPISSADLLCILLGPKLLLPMGCVKLGN